VVSSVRKIPITDLRAGTELLAQLDLSDEELAVRGISLETEEWVSGLGPFRSVCVELPGGEQYVLARSEWVPEFLDVHGTMSRGVDQIGPLLEALGLAQTQVTWMESSEQWSALLGGYDHERWLARMAAGGHS
jgi:hypothetical protein